MSTPAALVAPPVPAVQELALRQHTRAAATLRFLRRNPLVLIGALIVLGWIIASVFAPLIAPSGHSRLRFGSFQTSIASGPKAATPPRNDA